MWLFLSNAFLSIVIDKTDPDKLLVRARAAGDIQRVFGKRTKVIRTPRADYGWRAYVSRDRVKQAMVKEIDQITYPNFKDSVPEDDRHNAYARCWNALYDFQRQRLYPLPKRPKLHNWPPQYNILSLPFAEEVVVSDSVVRTTETTTTKVRVERTLPTDCFFISKSGSTEVGTAVRTDGPMTLIQDRDGKEEWYASHEWEPL